MQNIADQPFATVGERRRLRQGKPIQLALLGCGIVGSAVVDLIHANANHLATKAGAPLAVKRILVRDRSKQRSIACDPDCLTTDSKDILHDPDIDIVVELMGGEFPAHEFVKLAMEQGKSVVTANKLLLALHGPALLQHAVMHRVDLAFEGAVGGGIPIIRTLRDAFASDPMQKLTGILNGTCNYVLTQMRDAGSSFDVALEQAQQHGYAEADPSLDIDGHDAAHKLIVLAMLAFHAHLDRTGLSVEGIRNIEKIDHAYADRFGYVIKHLAIGRDLGYAIELRVHPTLIGKKSVLANVSDVLNAIMLEGRALGPALLYGRGAGGFPTAVSIVSDILDVARSIASGVAGMQTRSICVEHKVLRPLQDIVSRYYLRFSVDDKPGVIARLARALGDAGVSIEQLVQPGLNPVHGTSVDVVMITHNAQEGAVQKALEELRHESFMKKPVRLYRIEDL